MARRIEKVKYDPKDGKTTIHFTVTKKGTGEEIFTLESKEPPRPEFKEALQNLHTHLSDLCEFPKEYRKGISVRGVSFSWSHDIMGATITGLKELEDSNSPLVINTPHKPSEPYSDGAESPVLTSKCIAALEVLIDEAEAFLDGKRAQGVLQFQKKESGI